MPFPIAIQFNVIKNKLKTIYLQKILGIEDEDQGSDKRRTEVRARGKDEMRDSLAKIDFNKLKKILNIKEEEINNLLKENKEIQNLLQQIENVIVQLYLDQLPVHDFDDESENPLKDCKLLAANAAAFGIQKQNKSEKEKIVQIPETGSSVFAAEEDISTISTMSTILTNASTMIYFSNLIDKDNSEKSLPISPQIKI